MRSVYSYVRDIWKQPKKNLGKQVYQDRLVQWRQEPAVLRIERPTRIDRARSLGYKAKQGVVVARARVKKGTSKRPAVKGGRRPKRYGRLRLPRDKSKQRVAEERTAREFTNMEILNSYWVGEDGKNKWYEVILIDRSHASIKASRSLSWIANPSSRGRAFRGKTSAGQRGRNL